MIDSQQKEVLVTPGARELLNVALKGHEQRLIKAVVEEKFVPGESVVEITAADIERMVSRTHLVQERSYYYARYRQIILQAYLAVGLAFMVVGVYYNEFVDMFRAEPSRLALFGAGAAISLAAVFAKSLSSLRDIRRLRDEEARMRATELYNRSLRDELSKRHLM